MEDSHIADLDLDGKNHHLFGVFDGHGGMEVAEYVKRHFTKEYVKNKNYQAGKFQDSLYENFMNMDKCMLTQAGQKEIKEILKG